MLVRLVADGSVCVAFDERILAEYREVLARSNFPLNLAQIEGLLTQIEEEDFQITPRPIAIRLPDSDDLPFLEVTLSAKGEVLVTGNKKHYPPNSPRGVTVLSPEQCLELISR